MRTHDWRSFPRFAEESVKPGILRGIEGGPSLSSKSIRLSFVLDEQDISYFRTRFRSAKRAAKNADRTAVLAGAKKLVQEIQEASQAPRFVQQAAASLEDLAAIIEDEDYRAPKPVVDQVVAALAYFSNPDDLIPDEIPVLGFLDDAVMIKLVERDFKHELAAYRKFRRFRSGAEQRPWTGVAQERLSRRLDSERRKLRDEISRRQRADKNKGTFRFR